MRRWSPDLVNALLSITYMLLLESCISAVEACGPDPMVGFYHETAYGRASLASDLMEEFRAIIADAVVLSVLNKRMVTTRDSTALPGGKGVAVGYDA